MPVFMVERDLKGISGTALAGAQRAAISEAATMTGEGTPVRYIRSVFAPEDGRCFCLFDAATASDIQAVNERAGLPFRRIVPALDLAP